MAMPPLLSARMNKEVVMKTKNLRQEFAIRAAHLRESFADATPLAERLGSFVEDAAKELDAKQIALDSMFKQFDEHGFGAIYKNSLNQYGFVLHDASEQGAYRYQLFDRKGFFGHSTFSSAEEALLELCDNGYTEMVSPDTLDKLSATREWKFSTEALALRTAVQEGKYTWEEADRLYADLQLKYDPDLWAA